MDDLQSRKMYSIITGLLIGWEGYFILMVASSIRWCPTQGRISETTFALINRDFMQTSAWSRLSKCHFVIFYSCYANITHFFAKKKCKFLQTSMKQASPVRLETAPLTWSLKMTKSRLDSNFFETYYFSSRTHAYSIVRLPQAY